MGYKYYAVRNGHIPGIYLSWEECKKQVNGFKGQAYKGFNSIEDAQSFINNASNPKVQIDANISKESIHTSILYVYCDGSYCDKTKRYGSGGICLIFPDIDLNGGNTDPTVVHQFSFHGNESHLISMRNVAGEIEAAKYAMTYTVQKGYKHLILHYDYEGVAKWCTNEWKANLLGTQQYRDFYREISKQLSVEFIHIKGHSGNKYNDMADTLAKRSLGL